MKVNYVENVIEYSRTIEGMGEGLVLFSGNCNFCGILLKDISEKEWAAIKNSKCM